MSREVIEVLGLSEALKAAEVPLSPAIKANGFVFVSGTPPLDRKTGKIVRCDIVQQTELVMDNLMAILAEAGSSLEKVCKCSRIELRPCQIRHVNT